VRGGRASNTRWYESERSDATPRGWRGPLRRGLDECSFSVLRTTLGPQISRWPSRRLCPSVRPVIAVDGVGVGVDAADFDRLLWSGGLLDSLQSFGSRRSTLHVERQRGGLRSTGRGSAIAARLVASHSPGIELESQRDACFEPMCQRGRLSFRPLSEPMAGRTALTHTTRLGTKSLTWLCASI
jgi:hypothetical protein